MACRRVGLPRRRSDPHGPPRPKENMRPRTAIVIAISIALLAFASLEGFTPSGHTRIELTDEGSGTKLLSMVLEDGAPVTLAWRNSQFGLRVTERFHARGGLLIQDRVTFSNPAGPPPPRGRRSRISAPGCIRHCRFSRCCAAGSETGAAAAACRRCR